MKVITEEKILKYLFTSVCILCPILRLYRVKEIEMSAWLLLILDICMLCRMWKNKLKMRVIHFMVPILFVLCAHLIYILVTGGNILGMSHYMLYTASAVLFMPLFFDAFYAFPLYRAVVILSSVFAVIQLVVVKIFGYYIPGVLPISYAYEYVTEINGGALAKGMTVRPRSFFGEPSDFGAYAGIYLVVLLLTRKKFTKRDAREAMLISLGLVCTRSSTGLLLMIAAWGGYAFKVLISKRYTRSSVLVLVLMLGAGIGFLFTDTFRIFAERTFDLNQTGGTMGRISGYFIAFDPSNYSFLNLLFGHSLTSLQIFIPGWGLVMWYFGIIGVVSYIWCVRGLYKYAQTREQRCVSLLIAGMAFFLALFFYMHEIFYIGVYYAYGSLTKKGDCIQEFVQEK